MASLPICGLSSSASFHTKPRLVSSCSSSPLPHTLAYPLQNPNKVCRKIGRVICRAEFSQDAPLVTAIGACILSSFVFPVAKRVNDEEEEEEDSAIVSTDMRLAAMGIISFIPYFNWLSWVFAWLDTGKSRYAVYALVYLLPYLSSNLSISPEDSWLPITSIVLGIIHVQQASQMVMLRHFHSSETHLVTSHQTKESILTNIPRRKTVTMKTKKNLITHQEKK